MSENTPDLPAWSAPGNRHENKLVRLVDLVVTKTPPMIEDQAFVNCELVGPAVLMVLNGNAFDRCALDGPGALWQLDLERDYIGGIGMNRCLLRQCRLRGVGLAGSANFVQQFMDQLRGL